MLYKKTTKTYKDTQKNIEGNETNLKRKNNKKEI